MKKFILFGDSNTQYAFGDQGHWASDLAHYLQRKCDVLNRGFSGYNTNHVRIILPKIMSEFEPESVCGMTLMFGANDSTSSENKIQHVPLDKYRDNLAFIIDYLLDWGVKREKLIVISPPRIFDNKWIEHNGPQSTHFDRLVKDYAQACVEIATEKKLNHINMYKLILDEFGDNYEQLFCDGLHLSSKGGDLLFKNLLPIVKTNIECDLKFHFPYWKDLKPGENKIDE
jgi:lysophospholipase L1-like esterase